MLRSHRCGLCRYLLPEQQVQTAVESALDLVNLKDFMHRATHTLSGGQRQRVAIAGERHGTIGHVHITSLMLSPVRIPACMRSSGVCVSVCLRHLHVFSLGANYHGA
jgi:hypothetical protein